MLCSQTIFCHDFKSTERGDPLVHYDFIIVLFSITAKPPCTVNIFFLTSQTTLPLPSLNQLKKQPPEVFCKKNVLRNFAKFTGKHLCQSLFFNKIAGLRSATLLKKRLWHRYFPMNFAKFLTTPFIIEYLWWLLL